MTLRHPRLLPTPAGLVRMGVAASLIAATAVAAVPQTGAQVISGHDTSAPVNYAADRIELQDKQNRVILSGNVDVQQGDLQLRAANTVVNFTNVGSLQIQRITASGGVVVTRGDETATGDVGVYDFNQKIITMSGNATLKRGNGDTLHGGRFVIDLKSGVSSASGGRVSGTFSVPKQKTKD